MVKVLITDDNRFSRRMLQKHVSALGHEVEEAIHGMEALEKMDVYRPDVVLTDLLMPEMDGIELVHALRERGYTQPIVVISADIQAGTREEVLALGACCFINKPFTAESVADAVAIALQGVGRVDGGVEK